MVGLQACPSESFGGDRIRTEGMSQNIRCPSNSRFVSGLLHHPLQLAIRLDRPALPFIRRQPNKEVVGNLNQFAAVVLALIGGKVDEFAVELDFRPIESFDLGSAKTSESGDGEKWDGLGMDEGEERSQFLRCQDVYLLMVLSR